MSETYQSLDQLGNVEPLEPVVAHEPEIIREPQRDELNRSYATARGKTQSPESGSNRGRDGVTVNGKDMNSYLFGLSSK